MSNSTFDPSEFMSRFKERVGGMPACPICGKSSYSLEPYCAQIIVQDKTVGFILRKTLPSSIVICDNCGHLDLFALSAYGMLPTDGDSNAK